MQNLRKQRCASRFSNGSENCRTISLFFHTSKIFNKIVNKRIENRIVARLREGQFGFQRNKETREPIAVLEERTKLGKTAYVTIIDLEK